MPEPTTFAIPTEVVEKAYEIIPHHDVTREEVAEALDAVKRDIVRAYFTETDRNVLNEVIEQIAGDDNRWFGSSVRRKLEALR